MQEFKGYWGSGRWWLDEAMAWVVYYPGRFKGMCQSEREKKLHQERFYGRKFEVIPKDEINIGGMDDLTCLTR